MFLSTLQTFSEPKNIPVTKSVKVLQEKQKKYKSHIETCSIYSTYAYLRSVHFVLLLSQMNSTQNLQKLKSKLELV